MEDMAKFDRLFTSSSNSSSSRSEGIVKTGKPFLSPLWFTMKEQSSSNFVKLQSKFNPHKIKGDYIIKILIFFDAH